MNEGRGSRSQKLINNFAMNGRGADEESNEMNKERLEMM